MTTALDKLPSVGAARLPVSYEHAKTALEACARIDECQDWANKAEALASYAKQSGDHTLRKMADRIQARAIRRCGELLRQIEAKPGTRTDRPTAGTGLRLRTQAAKDAGLSERQQKTATRVARLDGSTFETLVESDDPPTIEQLAALGVMRRIAVVSARPGYSEATQAVGHIREFAEFCREHDPLFVARGTSGAHLANGLYLNIDCISRWLEQFAEETRRQHDHAETDRG